MPKTSFDALLKMMKNPQFDAQKVRTYIIPRNRDELLQIAKDAGNAVRVDRLLDDCVAAEMKFTPQEISLDGQVSALICFHRHSIPDVHVLC